MNRSIIKTPNLHHDFFSLSIKQHIPSSLPHLTTSFSSFSFNKLKNFNKKCYGIFFFFKPSMFSSLNLLPYEKLWNTKRTGVTWTKDFPLPHHKSFPLSLLIDIKVSIEKYLGSFNNLAQRDIFLLPEIGKTLMTEHLKYIITISGSVLEYHCESNI